MKVKILIPFLTGFLMTGYLIKGQQPIDTNRKLMKLFEANTQKWKDAYNSGDAKNLETLYSSDAIYCSSHVAGLEAIGRDKVVANFRNGMNGGGHIDAIEILSVTISNNVAALYCRYHATNSGAAVTGRNLLVLQKVNGHWLIVKHMTVV
jgi:ketosteroid isomerase-like protein